MQENIKQFNNQPELESEILREREITLENLTNKDVLKAVIIWYESVHIIDNLKEKWGEKAWKLYNENSEEFFKTFIDRDIGVGVITSDLSYANVSEKRFGFAIEDEVGRFTNSDAKLYVSFKKEDKELIKREFCEMKNKGLNKKEINKKIDEILEKMLDKKNLPIEFHANTNDRGNEKSNRQANYLLAEKITDAWKQAGLPVGEKFGCLDEEEKQEICEIKKDPKKLKPFWDSVKW